MLSLQRLLLISFYLIFSGGTITELNLSSSRDLGLQEMNKIIKTWEIDEYPDFLRSCAMPTTSWKIMKAKFSKKILHSLVFNSRESFVISFMGSSVTAGHDSLINDSFPVLVETTMKPVLEALGITLTVRNRAMGNNPCLPYCLCPLTFAGSDADMIHWEQSYNCNFHYDHIATLEQFIRQCIFIKSHPLVIFSDSSTTNWRAKDCPTDRQNTTSNKSRPGNNANTNNDKKDSQLLSSSPYHIVTQLNKKELHRWSLLQGLLELPHYVQAGIQTFTHTHHAKYKCMGPYVADWGKGAASWHPSKYGHRLRAGHHSYFWLSAWVETISDILQAMKTKSVKDIYNDVIVEQNQIYNNHIATPSTTTATTATTTLINPSTTATSSLVPSSPIIHFPAASYPSNVTDAIQCFTNYEPRSESIEGDRRISSLIVNPSNNNNYGWKSDIYESIVFHNPKIADKARSKGYLDFKYTLYGNNESGILTLAVNISRDGPMFLCQPPSIGKASANLLPLWDAQPLLVLIPRSYTPPTGNTTYLHSDCDYISSGSINFNI